MLNSDHIKTYLAFDGDIDSWARSHHAQEMTDQHWALIEELRLGLHLSFSGLASKAYVAQVEHRLMACTEDEETRNRLRAMAAVPPEVSPHR